MPVEPTGVETAGRLATTRARANRLCRTGAIGERMRSPESDDRELRRPAKTDYVTGAHIRTGGPVTEAIDRYLDLAIKTISNTIYGDANQKPWVPLVYDAAARETGRDWPSQAHSMIGVQRLQNVRQLCERAIQEGVPGDFIETGIWRGGACILMRAVLAAYGETGRNVWCCDSFEGLPLPDEASYPQDKDDQHHTYKELAVSLEMVQENFRKYDLLDDQVKWVKGFFEDTLDRIEAERFSVVRLDGDMYSSTMVALETLYPKLTPGGFLIVDDYGAIPQCKQAIEDYRGRNGIADEIHDIDWTGVWWRKMA